MIIIDTNVFSELVRPGPNEAVKAWVEAVGADLFLTAPTVAEVHVGLLGMPGGRRRYELTCASEAFFADFGERILPFDDTAAMYYATVSVSRRFGGRPISIFDAQIASICQSQGAQLATRNLKDFEHLGLTLIDPWNP